LQKSLQISPITGHYGAKVEVISIQQRYDKPVVLCLGFFDCMHVGHVRLLETARRLAEKNGANLALFTFSNNHFATLNRPTKLIYTFDERVLLYDSLGVDVVVSACFDNRFMSQIGAEFLTQLSQNLNLRGVVCGRDFTCGSDLSGADAVKKFFAGVCPVETVRLVKNAAFRKISSTLVRNLILQGKIERANKYLSQPFFFAGMVAHGRNKGHLLGFPTANVEIPSDKLAPMGVYSGAVEMDGATYKAIVNVGNTPTFGVETNRVEAHLLDFSGDLYGKTVKVSLLKYLRPIRKFDSEQDLKRQLQLDISCLKGGEK